MFRDLDAIDCKLVELLQMNARLSNKELAARVGLAPSSCLERVRRLEREGVFLGFHAEVDPQAVGIGLQAMIAVRLRRHTRDEVSAFHDHAISVPEVVAIYHVTGATDFLVHVAVRDAHHLRELALEAFTTRREVENLETSLIFEGERKGGLPILVREGAP